MSIVEYAAFFLRDSASVQRSIAVLKQELPSIEQSGDIRTLQMHRSTIRFLSRTEQYAEGVLGDADFLASLRDFILFVGRVKVPENVEVLVRKRGTEFGLYMEDNDSTVNASVAQPGWFTNDAFVGQVYGKEPIDLFNRPRSCGDGLLSRATGFKLYRSFEQKIAVHTALQMPEGFTLLLSLPTGAGKSLLTQMLAATVNGLTVAIVPTVALGLDQYRATRTILTNSLHSDQIACYCGEVSAKEAQRMIDAIREGTLRLLITSPEAIVRNERLKQALYCAAGNKYLKQLVIDEAHIVQDWGALFRPDFQMISVIRRDMLNLSSGLLKTVLLSATLTEDTIATLKTLMSDEKRWIELRCDALRTEPRYLIEKCNDQITLQRRMLHLCRTLPKPMILYEIKPEKAEQWKQLLNREGFTNVVTFTGETDDKNRNRIIKDWSEDKLDIVVATSAFGMGVDKPDVRTIIHATLPENVNRFYQEVGRGGRDGMPSLSVLCYCPHDDLSIQNYIASSRVLTVKSMVDRWFSMLRADVVEFNGNTVLLDTTTAPSHFTEQERERRGSQNLRWNLNLLLFFMRYGYLDFVEMIYVPSQNCYYVRVSMRDVELMQDVTALRQSLEPNREEEVLNVMNSFEVMKDMVGKAGRRCWADFFVNLFPNAAPSCGGCLSHPTAYCKDGNYTFNHTVPPYSSVLDESIKYKLRQLLVVRVETESWDVDKALELGARLNAQGFTVLVLPSAQNVDCTRFDGLILDANEFEYLVLKHPSLFMTGGIICAFDDDVRRNQNQFKSMRRLEQYGVPYVYYCRENMSISQESRSIRHLLNANTFTYREALEVK